MRPHLLRARRAVVRPRAIATMHRRWNGAGAFALTPPPGTLRGANLATAAAIVFSGGTPSDVTLLGIAGKQITSPTATTRADLYEGTPDLVNGTSFLLACILRELTLAASKCRVRLFQTAGYGTSEYTEIDLANRTTVAEGSDWGALGNPSGRPGTSVSPDLGGGVRIVTLDYPVTADVAAHPVRLSAMPDGGTTNGTQIYAVAKLATWNAPPVGYVYDDDGAAGALILPGETGGTVDV